MKKIKILYPEDGTVVSQQTDVQKRFLKVGDKTMAPDILDWLNLIRSNAPDHTQPHGIVVTWVGKYKNVVIRCAEDMYFRRGRMDFSVKNGESSSFIHSLKTNLPYFIRVVGEDEFGHKVQSDVRCFTTADENPRWIKVEGVSNVRDCGGWRTKDGSVVKQGILFRGGEMNRHMTITKSGMNFLERQLHIRTVLDMRGEEELSWVPSHGPALSQKVQWVNIPMRPYWEIFSDVQKNNYARAFRLLLKKGTFPLYFHCWGGADRTGTFTFLINAVLGIEEELLFRDYELTSLSIWGARSRHTDYFQRFLNGLSAVAPHSDLETKSRTYFKSCDIEDSEFEKLKKLMLE